MSAQSIELLEQLLATRVTEGLARGDERALRGLLRRHPEIDAEGIELAAAEIYGSLDRAPEPLPAHLRARLVAAGQRQLLQRGAGGEVRLFPRRSTPGSSRLGWWAAAAGLALAVAGWWPRPSEAPPLPMAEPPLTVAEQRRQLVAEAADVQTLAWSATEDRAAAGASGDVVWSSSRQQGFLRIRGLEVNDPRAAQYQLWIFDRQRDERYPVDGGVFDVPAGAEEAIVPIDAKIPVGEPYLFAVTVERPGGVVVSDRERIVLVAQA